MIDNYYNVEQRITRTKFKVAKYVCHTQHRLVMLAKKENELVFQSQMFP
jgi:hypothetical protein